MTAKRTKAMDRFWRIYFWIIIIMWIILIEALITGKQLLPETYTIYFKSIMAGCYLTTTIGLFGYAYQKNILSSDFWRLFFCFLVFWEINATLFIYQPTPDSSRFSNWAGLILIAPLYISLFLYAFKYKR